MKRIVWLWSEQIDEMFIQNSGSKIKCTKVPQYVLKLVFFTHLVVWQLGPSPYTFLVRQSHFCQLSQKSFEQRKEMTFDCGLASIRAAVVCG